MSRFSTPGQSAVTLGKRSLSVLLAILTSAVVAGLSSGDALAVGSQALTVDQDASVRVSIGKSRLTSLASATLTVPAGAAVDFGFQFRVRGSSSYLAKFSAAPDGTTFSGSFIRIKGARQTALGSPLHLGITAAAGDKIHLEATVVAKRAVKLYLRAWKDGTAKPATWQLALTDSSSSRITKPGRTYLWAQAQAKAPAATQLVYESASARAYSAARAAKVGVSSPTSPTSPTTPTGSGSDTFTLGVIGDTQDEIYSSSDARFPRRTAWLAANKDKLGIKYVLQTGDLGSWAWLATNQYVNAKNAMANLDTAGIPYTIAIGNHDTEAVGWDGIAGSTGLGGSAFASSPLCPSKVGAANCNSNWLVRQTGPFNSYFPASSVKNVGGAYEAGKADNIWTTFTANDTKWLVLTLELWQRPAVVTWAKDVVASHPDYNVIISTHSYLDGGGTISTSNGGYGATAPSYLYDQVVSKYSNVKMVFSGHVGSQNSRQDTPNGNTVVSYLGNELGNDAAFRVLTINTKTGTVTSTVYNASLTAVGNTSNTIRLIH